MTKADWLGALPTVGTILVVLLGALAARGLNRASASKSIAEGASEMVGALRAELKEVRAELKEVRAELRDVKSTAERAEDHLEMAADILRAHNLPIPWEVAS